jgi:hypothetical protein
MMRAGERDRTKQQKEEYGVFRPFQVPVVLGCEKGVSSLRGRGRERESREEGKKVGYAARLHEM